MQTVVLLMWRKAVANNLAAALEEKSGIHIHYEQDYSDAEASIKNQSAKAALIEVSQNGEFDVSYCLNLCLSLREKTPDCKLILMCPEQDKDCVAAAVDAKKNRRIDEFIFYDTSIEYLATKLISM